MSQHSQSSRASHSAKKPAASSRSSQVSVFASSRPLAPTSARGGIEAREDEGPSRKRAKVIAERHSSVDDDETQLEEDESLELFAGSDSLGDEAPPNSDLTSLSSFHFISFHFVLIFFFFFFFFFFLFVPDFTNMDLSRLAAKRGEESVKLLKTLTKLMVSREATKPVRQNLGKKLRLKLTKNLYPSSAQIDEMICEETKAEVALPSLSEWVSSLLF